MSARVLERIVEYFDGYVTVTLDLAVTVSFKVMPRSNRCTDVSHNVIGSVLLKFRSIKFFKEVAMTMVAMTMVAMVKIAMATS